MRRRPLPVAAPPPAPVPDPSVLTRDGVESDGYLIGGDSILQPTGGAQGQAPAVVRLGVRRIQEDQLLILGQRLLMLACCQQRVGQQEMRTRLGRIEQGQLSEEGEGAGDQATPLQVPGNFQVPIDRESGSSRSASRSLASPR